MQATISILCMFICMYDVTYVETLFLHKINKNM